MGAAATAAILLVPTFAFAGCGGDTPPEGDDQPPADTTANVVDKSGTPYVSALDEYKVSGVNAKWIWTDRFISNSYVAFRKTFDLAEVDANASLGVSAVSKCYVWVNGELVIFDGPSKRGLTKYDGFFERVKIGDKLVAGSNNVTVLVSFNGRDSNSYVEPETENDDGSTSKVAGLVCEIKSGSTTVGTDESWKCLRLKEYKNKSQLRDEWPDYEQCAMLGEWNLYYDARDAAGEFYSPAFDDGKWAAATVVGKIGEKPYNDLYECMTPPFAFDKTYTDFAASGTVVGKKTTATTIKLDFPENMQFSLYFEATADAAGGKLTYYTDTYESQGLNSFKDTYVFKQGEQSFESYPWRTGNTLIMEVPAGITFTKIGYRRSGYDSDNAGEFASDDSDLNTLWIKARNTLKICMRDGYMDCPERERSPYIGDATNQIAETFYCLDEKSYAMTKKTILTLLGWVTDNGEIPLRSPSKTLNECPAQTLAFLTSVYEYYLYSGDRATVEKIYPILLNYLKLWQMGDDGCIVYRNGTFMWTDWGTGQDDKVMQNCWYYYALKTTKALAEEFGKTSDLEFFTSRMTSIETGFRKYRKADGYASGDSYDDRSNALAVVCGLADSDDYADITEILKTVKGASPYMEKYVLEALCMMGEYEAARERMLERYEPMIKDKCSTLWELWGKNLGTVNHGWTGGPLTVMSKYFMGVAPTSAGYASYAVCLQDMFDSFTGSVHTVRGDIEVKLTKSGGVTTVELTAPSGAAGTVRLPKTMGESMTVTGDGYTVKNGDATYHEFTVTGGKYTAVLR